MSFYSSPLFPDPTVYHKQQEPWWHSSLLAIVLLSIAVWLVYGQMLRMDLVFDDLDVIRHNEAITSFSNLSVLYTEEYFTASGEYTYRPLVTLSYFIDHAIAGKQAWIYHLHNLILHNLNVLLVYTLFLLLRAGRLRAFAIALIFAIHPLQTEAVLFPGFREDLQMAFGMLGASCCLALDRERRGFLWVPLAAIAYALALFAKEGALLLPFAWIIYDSILSISLVRRPVSFGWRYVPLLVVIVFYVAVRFVIMANPRTEELDVIERIPIAQRFLTAPYLFAYYVWRFLWPWPLCLVHEIEPLRMIDGVFYASLAVAAAAAAVWIAFSWRHSWLWLAGLWVIGTFAAVSNVYQIVNLWAERFYYSINVGTAAIVVVALGALWRKAIAAVEPARRPVVRVAGGALVAVLIWAAAITDIARILEARTGLALWRATAKCAPNNGTVLATLAIEELKAGRLDEAERVARASLPHGGGTYRVNYILGQAAMRRRQWHRAIEHFEQARTVPPPSQENFRSLLLSLATAYLEAEQPEKAFDIIDPFLEQNPFDTTGHLLYLETQMRLLEKSRSPA